MPKFSVEVFIDRLSDQRKELDRCRIRGVDILPLLLAQCNVHTLYLLKHVQSRFLSFSVRPSSFIIDNNSRSNNNDVIVNSLPSYSMFDFKIKYLHSTTNVNLVYTDSPLGKDKKIKRHDRLVGILRKVPKGLLKRLYSTPFAFLNLRSMKRKGTNYSVKNIFVNKKCVLQDLCHYPDPRQYNLLFLCQVKQVHKSQNTLLFHKIFYS